MVQYYGRHVPELSTLSGPLNELQRKDAVFNWTQQQQSAFEKLKSELAGRRVLIYFNEKRNLFLETDASEYAVGAVLFHIGKSEINSNIKAQTAEQGISYSLSTLSAAKRNYSQIEKEALAIIFGIKKYDKYLMGWHFNLYTDHKPLVRLFDSKQATSSTAAAEIQRWFLFMSNYDIMVEYKKGINNSNAELFLASLCRQRTQHLKS